MYKFFLFVPHFSAFRISRCVSIPHSISSFRMLSNEFRIPHPNFDIFSDSTHVIKRFPYSAFTSLIVQIFPNFASVFSILRNVISAQPCSPSNLYITNQYCSDYGTWCNTGNDGIRLRINNSQLISITYLWWQFWRVRKSLLGSHFSRCLQCLLFIRHFAFGNIFRLVVYFWNF